MTTNRNPLLDGLRSGTYNTICFEKIKTEHFIPAIDEALKQAQANIDALRTNNEAPTFANTIDALEFASELLDEVSNIYFTLMSCNSDDEFKALAQEIGPKMSAYSSSILMDPVIFDRVKTIYENREDFELTDEQHRLLEINYRSFVRNGALLDDDKKAQLKEINIEMSKLGPQFGKNVLSATNSFELHITDKAELDGIPESALKAAAFMAKQKGKDGGWLFNLQVPSMLPVIKYAKNRELRKTLNKAYGSRAFNDQFDNQEILKKIAGLRLKRAQLLGYDTHAHYVLEQRMAEDPTTVMHFLDGIYKVAHPAAKKEHAELCDFARELDNLDTLQGWDAAYYSNKLKQQKFEFDDEEVRPYLQMEKVIDGMFTVANKLYGINFKQVEVPVYHESVVAYEVTEKNGDYTGLIYLDLYPRETKRGGAWMTSFLTQGTLNGSLQRPQVLICANLTPSTEDTPSLLRLDEAGTLFHEFGHALHGLLSDCTYTSLASPNVYWDFVELPSQVMENWLTEKEALDLFAVHYETGEKIPMELVEKIKKAQTFMSGMANIRQLSLGYLDMAWHATDPTDVDDVAAYENKVSEKTRLYPADASKNTSCSFSHIFAGGYSSGYYSYKWAEVLDADAFEFFKEKGIFDAETATSFRTEILARGNTKHPMDLYVQFRGRKPDADALLRRDGLLK